MTSFNDGQTKLIFSPPVREMGHQVAELVKNCPPLDTNSTYCNLLQCHHFADTSCAVIQNNALVGFVSGYLIPTKEGEPDTLFIWQVAVDASQRGQNLGVRMMQDILARPACKNVCFLETTITEDNSASIRMFEKLSESLNAETIQKVDRFDRDTHFNGLHDTEVVYRIGHFTPNSQNH